MDEMKHMKKRILAAAGKEQADIVFKNAKYVNVYTETVETGDIAISGEYIVGIGKDYQGIQEIDSKDFIICPGFIDGHIHIESSMVSPGEFERIVLPHGTTTVVTDPHEVANVAGKNGIDYILSEEEKMILDVFVMLPSCVPATDLDESGVSLYADKLHDYYNNPKVLGLAELMDFHGTVRAERQIIEKIYDTKCAHKKIDGHAPGLTGNDLAAYITAGVTSDHECSTYQEALEKLKLGQYIMIREGTAAKNLNGLKKILQKPYCNRAMFVTDDIHPGDLINYGHIDYIVRKAIELGADPVMAIKMGTFNASEYFGLLDRGSIAPGKKADIVLLNNLTELKVLKVYKNGELYLDKKTIEYDDNGKYIKKYSSVFHSFKMDDISVSDITVKVQGDKFNVIELVKDEILTKKTVEEWCEFNGVAPGVNLEKDIVKVVVIERHRNTGHIGVGFIKGYGLKRGAVASSVAHDSHNLIVAGTNDEDIVCAANRVNHNEGGLAVACNGQILGDLPLPIAGLMSDKSVYVVSEKISNLKEIVQKLSCTGNIDPFMTLAFASLPVIPEIRINTNGLIDVDKHEIIQLFI